MLLAERQGVGALGDIVGALVELGGQLLKAGIEFGTQAYTLEMQKKIAKLTAQQQIVVMQKQAEIDMLLAAQAAEYDKQKTAQIVDATVGTGSLALWAVGGLLAFMLLRGR